MSNHIKPYPKRIKLAKVFEEIVFNYSGDPFEMMAKFVSNNYRRRRKT